MDKLVLKEWLAIADYYGCDVDDSEQGVWRISFSNSLSMQINEHGKISSFLGLRQSLNIS